MEFLLENKLIELYPSEVLRMAYIEAEMDKTMGKLDKEMDSIRSGSSIDSVSDNQKERMLLSTSSGQLFARHLDVPELAIEIERAVWQVERALKAQNELREEKVELDVATKK